MAMREASRAQKRLLFIKIYNFAMEVYDSPGFGIGCWRSCGRQEWELISHEVILQLLFSCAHSLNTSNTSFSLLFVHALRVRTRVLGRHTCAIFQRGEKKKDLWAMERLVPSARVRRVNGDSRVFLKMRDQHTPGWRDYFPEIA